MLPQLDVFIDETARDDLFDIWKFIAESNASDATADWFIARIEARLRENRQRPLYRHGAP